jgi:PAS domain-containing protein
VSLARSYAGDPLYFISQIEDITDRKRSEELLVKNELSLQGILQSTADGILAVDLEGKVLFANKQFSKMWKIPQEVASNKIETILLEFVLDQLINPQDFHQKVGDPLQRRQNF